ncbi:MAG: hypothetical protein E4H01_04160 [Lysobacterales bacterium]|nr:MAG: hypothetical protein E4H01_04160 [Xanthomonadales bacterium]
MTVNDLVRRAMRTLGVLRAGENPKPSEAADAIATLNDMLNAWIYEGMDLEFVQDLTGTDTLPYPDDHIAAFRYNLAVELAPEFGVQIDAVTAGLAGKYYRALRTANVSPDTLSIDDALSPIYSRGIFQDFS